MNPEDVRDWLQRIFASPFAEREALYKQFAGEMWKSNPALGKQIASWARNGVFLFEAYYQALKSVLERSDLTEDEKAEALRDFSDFCAFIEMSVQDHSGLVSLDLAFDFAMNALFAGLRARLSAAEVEKLKADFLTDWQRSAAKEAVKKRIENMRWVPHATEIAKQSRIKNPLPTQDDVAEKIISRFQSDPELSKIFLPGRRQLADHVSKLEGKGEILRRAGSRRK
jgi:hypothetical protein